MASWGILLLGSQSELTGLAALNITGFVINFSYIMIALNEIREIIDKN